jgi:DNA polymerase (family X)
MRANDEVAAALVRLMRLQQLEDGSAQSFRTRAYERAADGVRMYPRDVSTLTMKELTAIDGVGQSTAQKIRELIDTGHITVLDELSAKYPPDFVALLQVPGVGPATAVMLRDRLGVETVDQLKEAVDSQQLRELPGMGARTEEKIGKAIEQLGLAGKERRVPIAVALGVADRLVGRVRALDGVETVRYCGSLRRFRDTIADIDLLVVADDPPSVVEGFTEDATETIKAGAGGASIRSDELQVDLRIVAADQFGSASLYFTGSKAHNIALRQRAIASGWLLNEYGLMEGDTVIASRTEEDVYRALGLDFIPPELREDTGEIELAAEHALPDLVTVEDLRGDLHVHSTWSGDGRSSLEDMIGAASERGLEYVAITEHGEDLSINGLSRDKVLEERGRIEELRAEHPELTILHGAELNIDPDGNVDYDPGFLAGFDWCDASVHSHFDLPAERQTMRILAAMANPAVDAIGHLTGRRIGRRPGIELDFDAILDGAAATGTALEINSHIDRLDVPADLLIRARDRDDVVYTISTDAHDVTEFAKARWGVQNARRGWVERSRVLNTLPAEQFLARLARTHG